MGSRRVWAAAALSLVALLAVAVVFSRSASGRLDDVRVALDEAVPADAEGVDPAAFCTPVDEFPLPEDFTTFTQEGPTFDSWLLDRARVRFRIEADPGEDRPAREVRLDFAARDDGWCIEQADIEEF